MIGDDQIDGETSLAKPAAPTIQHCFIGLGNNPRLVRDALSHFGFQELAKGMQFSDKYRFKWTQTSSEVNYMKFREGEHIVNHISNARIFTTKITTLEILEQLKIALENGEVPSALRLKDFFPETYRLDVAADLVNFLNSKTGGCWLQKKACSNQGKGIRLVGDVKAYKEEIMTINKQEEDSTQMLVEKLEKMGIENEGGAGASTTSSANKWKDMNMLAKELREIVVQKYCENPLLVDGRKFDIRAYMLIVCMKPYLVLYHPGYVRLSLNPYTSTSFTDKMTHLTNNSVQKNHPDYKSLKEKSIISIEALVKDLVERGLVQSADEYHSRVDNKIQEIMRLVFVTIKDKLDRKFGCFELYGFDFLIDENLNPFLIEANTNPALYTDTQVQKELLPPLVEDVVQMAVEAHGFGKVEGSEEVRRVAEKVAQRETRLRYEVIYYENA
ncbi:hypothetical protein FGO68_gene174 [Halteria grandinella]|uniref:Tubulin-tyrosine ligase n=1 Tax=Halteria grandinella TaxID=5974 RepID=A0A8J8NVH1_HALGN|nr:hypothetical protein FGO68_gene174 [Halteria grandinella]